MYDVRAHDVSDFPALIRESFVIFVIVCKVQLSVNSVKCLLPPLAVIIYFFNYSAV